MIADLKPYPTVKDSGVPWLGSVPTHWERRRLKSLLRTVDRRSTTGTEPLLSLRRDHGIVVYSEHFSRPAQGATTVGYKIVNRGQLVVNRLQANNGLVFDSSLDGLVSPDYSVFEPRDQIVMRYLSLLLRTATYRNHFRRESTGLGTGSAGFLRLYDDRFLDTPVALPPTPEQAAIVGFLNHADRRIRAYIGAKQKLITLLGEQEQGIILRAVNRGLESNVRLRSSGVDWLGDVPAHWEISRLKWLANIKTGGRDTVDRQDDAAYPFFVRSQTVEHIDTYSFDGEAVLTAGDGAGVAKVFHYVDGKFDYHQRVYKFSNFRRVRGKFFFHYFRATLRFEAFRETAKSTVDSLRLPMLQDFPVPVPPVDEQDMIVRLVESETAHLTKAIYRTREEIRLLREYRTRLIGDVVTGKIDVREASACLPGYVDEPELSEAIVGEPDAYEASDELDTAPEEAEA